MAVVEHEQNMFHNLHTYTKHDLCEGSIVALLFYRIAVSIF